MISNERENVYFRLFFLHFYTKWFANEDYNKVKLIKMLKKNTGYNKDERKLTKMKAQCKPGLGAI